jgi:hypothetical protein
MQVCWIQWYILLFLILYTRLHVYICFFRHHRTALGADGWCRGSNYCKCNFIGFNCIFLYLLGCICTVVFTFVAITVWLWGLMGGARGAKSKNK